MEVVVVHKIGHFYGRHKYMIPFGFKVISEQIWDTLSIAYFWMLPKTTSSSVFNIFKQFQDSFDVGSKGLLTLNVYW